MALEADFVAAMAGAPRPSQAGDDRLAGSAPAGAPADETRHGARRGTGRATARTALVLTLCLGGIAGTLFARSVFLTARSVSPLPWWDQWDVLLDLARWHLGEYRAADLWGLHNEHRIFFPRLLFIVDLFAFHGTNTFLCGAILVFQLLHLAVLAQLARAARLGAAVATALVAFAGVCLFAPTQLENFAWGFQVQFVGVYLAASASFLYLSRCAERDRNGSLAASIACASVATYTMANGILAWPLLLALCAWLRLPRRVWAAVAMASVVVGGSFLHGHKTGSDMLAVLADPQRVADYAALFVGGPFQAFGDSVARTMGALGIGSAVVASVWFLRSARRRDPAGAAILAIAFFVAGTVLLAAIGRQDHPVTQALSSRYGTPALLFWWTQPALCAVALSRRQVALSRAQLALLALCLAFAIALLAEWQRDSRVAGFYLSTRTRAAVALLTGVDDVADIRPVQPDAYLAFLLRPLLRLQRISIYAEAPPPLGAALVRSYPLAAPTRCTGILERVEELPAAPPPEEGATSRPSWLRPGVQATGWAYDLAAGAPAREVVLVDDEGTLVGLGRTYESRDDVNQFDARIPRGAAIGWFGLAWRRDTPRLRAYAVLADGTACPLAIAVDSTAPASSPR